MICLLFRPDPFAIYDIGEDASRNENSRLDMVVIGIIISLSGIIIMESCSRLLGIIVALIGLALLMKWRKKSGVDDR